MAKNGRIKFTRFRIIKNLIVISTTFSLLFTAYDGLSMLQSTMNGALGIGTKSQLALYAAMGTVSLFLPKYAINKLGSKKTFFIGTLFYWPYVAANFYAHWLTLIPSAVLSGIGAALLWSSQGTYFNESAALYCKLSLEQEEHAKKKSEVPASNYKNIEQSSTENLKSWKEQLLLNSGMSRGNLNGICNEGFNETNFPPTDFEDISEKGLDLNPASDEPFHSEFDKREKIIFEDKSIKMSTNTCSIGGNIRKPCPEAKRIIYSEHQNTELEHYNSSNQHDENVSKCVGTPSGIFHQRIDTGPRVEIISENNTPTDKSNTIPKIESITSRFFGCHGLAYYASQIWSNLMTYFILNMGSVQSVTRTSNCSCGAGFCSTEYINEGNDISDISTESRYLLTGIAVSLSLTGVVMAFFFLDPLDTDKEPEPMSWEHLMSTFSHFKKKEQLLLIPLPFFLGMAQGFYTADFTKSYIQCAWDTSHVGLVTVSYGLCCGVASSISGCIVKYTGRIPLFLMNQAFNIGVSILLLMWDPDPNNPFMFYMAAGLWGATIGFLFSPILSFYGILFKMDEEVAFPSFHFCNGMGWTLSFCYSDYICTSIKIYIMMVVSSIGIIGYLFAERNFKLTKKEEITTKLSVDG